MKTAVEPNSLQALRLAQGLTLDQTAALLAERLGEESRSHVSVWKIENRGTDKNSVIQALADIYRTTPETILQAIQKTRT